jgi:predicted metalloprotease
VKHRVAAFVAAFLVAAGCFVGSSEDGGGDDGADPGGQPSAGATRADGTMTAEEFQQDIGDAVGLAEQYWGGRVRRFQPVQEVIAYERDGEVDCGGEPVPRNNAVYCPAGDFIAYDVNFAVAAFRQVGDAFLFYLLGHEYAHAVQQRLGISSRFTIDHELQADCMAGAYIGDSVRDKDLTLDEGDLDEFQSGLLAVGDDPSIPWFAPGAHGTAEQRTQAFFQGYEQSLDACGL